MNNLIIVTDVNSKSNILLDNILKFTNSTVIDASTKTIDELKEGICKTDDSNIIVYNMHLVKFIIDSNTKKIAAKKALDYKRFIIDINETLNHIIIFNKYYISGLGEKIPYHGIGNQHMNIKFVTD